MKTTTLFLAAAMLLAVAACNTGAKSSTTAATTTATTADGAISDAFGTMPKAGANYGAGVATNAKPMDYSTFVKTVAEKGTAETVVTGTVLEVCQKKGCWMTLQPTGTTAEELSVRFKDYSFFMPKTLSGSKVVVAGTASKKEVSVEDLRHYAEDAGKSAEEIAAITEPKMEIELMATGVRVL